jgi:hypothetical protein
MMKITIYTLIILVVLTSCSIQSRRYRKGFYVESIITNKKKNSEIKLKEKFLVDTPKIETRNSETLSIKVLMKSENTMKTKTIDISQNHFTTQNIIKPVPSKIKAPRHFTYNTKSMKKRFLKKTLIKLKKDDAFFSSKTLPDSRNAWLAISLGLLAILLIGAAFLIPALFIYPIAFVILIVSLESLSILFFLQIMKSQTSNKFQKTIASIGAVLSMLPLLLLALAIVILVVFVLFFYRFPVINL